jgi:hypothetical protein
VILNAYPLQATEAVYLSKYKFDIYFNSVVYIVRSWKCELWVPQGGQQTLTVKMFAFNLPVRCVPDVLWQPVILIETYLG